MSEIVQVFGINWKLLLIQAVNFSILLIVLWWFLYRPLARIVEKRQQEIEKGVSDAREAKEKLDNIQREEDSIIEQATQRGEKVVEKAVRHAKEREAEVVAQANSRTEQILAEAQEKAEEIKRLAHEESKAEIARVAVLASEKILREQSNKTV